MKKGWPKEGRRRRLYPGRQPLGRFPWLSSLLSILFLFFLWLSPRSLLAEKIELKGLLSSWAAFSAQKSVPSQLGFRWVPTVGLNEPLSRARFIEVEFSLDGNGTAEFKSLRNMVSEGRIKLYRAQARYSSSRFEARAGLQKISFGSAAFLRPLMWFDRLDPRDPLQITEGVYGLLLRYYFLSNTNLWFWALYGNDRPKGWEFLATARKRPEGGGRLQIPWGKGELGFSFHYRQAYYSGQSNQGQMNQTDAMAWTMMTLLHEGGVDPLRKPMSHLLIKPVYSLCLYSQPTHPGSLLLPRSERDELDRFKTKDYNQGNNKKSRSFPEYRLGLDGKWDLGVGLWLEAVLVRQETVVLATNRQAALTLGLDYTFPLGQGLHLLAEYFEQRSGRNAWNRCEAVQFAVLSLSYPLSLLDNLTTVAFYDRQNQDTYLFFRWQRTYDRWNFHLMAFWNPERFAIYRVLNTSTSHLFAGKGLQLMFVFYY